MGWLSEGTVEYRQQRAREWGMKWDKDEQFKKERHVSKLNPAAVDCRDRQGRRRLDCCDGKQYEQR